MKYAFSIAIAMLISGCVDDSFRDLELRPYHEEIFIFGAGQGTTPAENCRNVLVRDRLYPGYSVNNTGCVKEAFRSPQEAMREFYDLIVNRAFVGELLMYRATVRVDRTYTPEQASCTTTHYWWGSDTSCSTVAATWDVWVGANDAEGETTYDSDLNWWETKSVNDLVVEAFESLGWMQYIQ